MQFFLDEALDINNTVEENLSIAQKWLETAYNWAAAFLPKLIAAAIIFLAGWWLVKLVCKISVRAMTRAKIDKTVISFLNSILNAALKVLIILCVLSTVGFDMTTLIATVSAATVAIGLALKDSLANVASGTLIIINKKLKVGDYIETEGLQGTVVKIDMMYTTLCTYNNREILIPNSRLTSNNVINYFVREKRRVDLVIPIPYEADVEKARKVIMDLLDESELVLHEENNKVQVDLRFGECRGKSEEHGHHYIVSSEKVSQHDRSARQCREYKIADKCRYERKEHAPENIDIVAECSPCPFQRIPDGKIEEQHDQYEENAESACRHRVRRNDDPRDQTPQLPTQNIAGLQLHILGCIGIYHLQ